MHEIIFLLEHKDAFTNHICSSYPFSESFIERYRNFLNWGFISQNEKLPWSTSLIEKYKDSWNWANLGENEALPWSDELILRYANKWGILENQSAWCLTNNSSIIWSKNIISQFPEKFSGVWLAQRTELLNNHPDLLEQFKDTLWWEYISGNEYMNWSEKLIDHFISYWDWDSLSANDAVGWTNELKEKYKDLFNQHHCKGRYAHIRRQDDFDPSEEADTLVIVPYTSEEYETVKRLNPPDYLSLDERVPWCDELIASLENEWNWSYLSSNRALPWSEKLIDMYLDKWDFGTLVELPDNVSYFTGGLSTNSALPWSLNLLKKYESRWNWITLSYTEDIPWSFEILRQFENRWDWSKLTYNNHMWEKIFYPSLDEEIIGALLTIVNKRVYPF